MNSKNRSVLDTPHHRIGNFDINENDERFIDYPAAFEHRKNYINAVYIPKTSSDLISPKLKSRTHARFLADKYACSVPRRLKDPTKQSRRKLAYQKFLDRRDGLNLAPTVAEQRIHEWVIDPERQLGGYGVFGDGALKGGRDYEKIGENRRRTVNCQPENSLPGDPDVGKIQTHFGRFSQKKESESDGGRNMMTSIHDSHMRALHHIDRNFPDYHEKKRYRKNQKNPNIDLTGPSEDIDIPFEDEDFLGDPHDFPIDKPDEYPDEHKYDDNNDRHQLEFDLPDYHDDDQDVVLDPVSRYPRRNRSNRPIFIPGTSKSQPHSGVSRHVGRYGNGISKKKGCFRVGRSY